MFEFHLTFHVLDVHVSVAGSVQGHTNTMVGVEERLFKLPIAADATVDVDQAISRNLIQRQRSEELEEN